MRSNRARPGGTTPGGFSNLCRNLGVGGLAGLDLLENWLAGLHSGTTPGPQGRLFLEVFCGGRASGGTGRCPYGHAFSLVRSIWENRGTASGIHAERNQGDEGEKVDLGGVPQTHSDEPPIHRGGPSRRGAGLPFPTDSQQLGPGGHGVVSFLVILDNFPST